MESTPQPLSEHQPTPREARLRRLRRLRDAAFGTDSYGLVLLFLIGEYILLTVDWTGRLSAIVGAIWLGLTTLLTFRTSRVPRRVQHLVRILVAITVLAGIGVALGSGTRAHGAVVTLTALLVLLNPVAIGWRIAHHTRVTAQTILGALCVYVLIGLVFANGDYALQLVSGSSFFAQPGHHGPSDFVYFSYITMTTVGYGDLSPATGLPRTYAVTESLTGQIFLVVLVARLVSLYTPLGGRRAERHEGSREAAPGTGTSPPER